MARQKTRSNRPMQALRKLALEFPGTEEGVACEGTPIERRTIKTVGKAFLFLGVGDAMFKLGASLPAASKLAMKEPDHYKAGKSGWVKVIFGNEPPPLARLEKWIGESYQLMTAGKKPAKGSASRCFKMAT